MSAKVAKVNRRIIAAHSFPAVNDTANIRPGKEIPPVPVDHSRRIRRIAKSLRWPVSLAVQLYMTRTGYGPKPVISDAEKRIMDQKQAMTA